MSIGNEETDHSYTSNIVCPHCGYSWGDSWELRLSDGDGIRIDCGSCEKPMKVECQISVTYSTERIDES